MSSHVSDFIYKRYELSLKDDSPVLANNVREIGLALFGLGRIGIIHAENILKIPGATLLYFVEEDKIKAAKLAKKWNLSATQIVSAEDQHIIFSDPRVNAIIVCTPTFAHEELVLKGLNAGKAVFCEKPLASTYEGMKKCYELARLKEKSLFCAFNRRFDPTFSDIERRVKSGDIGTIHIVKTCSRDSPKPSIEYLKTSGGIFHDCAVHDIDMICWIVGAWPRKAFASASAFQDDIKAIDDHDTVAITMTFSSGVIGIIDLSRTAIYGYDQRLEVFGSSGMLGSGDVRPVSTQFSSPTGTQTVPICYSFASRYNQAYFLEMEAFIKEVSSECPQSSIPGENILAINKIACACEESARTGKLIEISY